MRYDDYDPLVEPARPTAGLPRLVIGTLMTVLLCLMLGRTLWAILPLLLPPQIWSALLEGLEAARTPGAVVVNLLLFALLTVSLGIVLRKVHFRSLMGLIGPLATSVHQFRRVAVALVLLFTATSILPFPDQFAPTPSLPFQKWLLFLPAALIGLLIQTSAEELLFRGYLQSQLAARFAHPAIWIGLPSVAFGALHYDPDIPAGNAWIIMLWAGLFGAAAADLTARSGTLGPAIALHMVNNCAAILIAAPTGNFDGLALYTFPFSLASSDMLMLWAPVDLMILLCSWLAARLALRR